MDTFRYIKVLNACKTTKIFCRSNCPPGRRTKVENRLVFQNIEEAQFSGYRACLVCRPLDGKPGPWVPKSKR
ncbi:MAG: hypothetical protein FI727_00485 [SAR202 cluster bacterium]|nr:hypothetical protein [SAR202 cluster bacterium]